MTIDSTDAGFQRTLKIASSGMQAQAERLRHVSENIANVDTPGYRRKVIGFESVLDRGKPSGQVQSTGVSLDQTNLTRVFEPGHPMADSEGFYDGSNVNIVLEIADAREAQRTYEANLRVFEQARQMSRNLLDLLRR